MDTFKFLSTTALFSLALAFSGESIARADVLPYGAEDCGYKQGVYSTDPSLIGKKCEYEPGKSGTCQKTTCYPHARPPTPGEDAAAAPPATGFDCILCEQPDSGTASDSSATDPATEGSNGASGGNKSSGGCSVGGSARTAAPWLLAIAAALAITGARRRRNAR